MGRNRISRIIDRWLDGGGPLFPPITRRVVDHCHRLWEACPSIGKLTATYGPRSPGGSVSFEDRFNADALRELDQMRSWFPSDHWRVFEAVVRDGHSAGSAGAALADGTPAAIATAKAVVGSIATQIALRKGWT